ncbi:MAG: hypothetical protein HFI86_00975 [Bacilli bacterium]|nr:hypothetical protein [Bacilli bacterium]
MNKIILLVGDSGSGKDFVLSVANKYESIEVVKRFISREPRDGEENSISSIFSTPIEEIKKLDYYYEGAEKGRWYGIRKADLDKVLAKGKNPMVVCPNYNNMLKMLEDYEGNVVPYFIYRGYSDEELEKWRASLVARGSSSTEIEARETKRDKYFKELYVNHGEYSSNVILNLYDITTEEDIKLQLENLCQKNDIDIDFIEKSRNR